MILKKFGDHFSDQNVFLVFGKPEVKRRPAKVFDERKMDAGINWAGACFLP